MEIRTATEHDVDAITDLQNALLAHTTIEWRDEPHTAREPHRLDPRPRRRPGRRNCRRMLSHVMKISRNGQVSIPAAARARWQAERVVVVDLGDRLVVRPLPSEPIEALIGKYASCGPTSSGASASARADEAGREHRKTS